MIDVSAAAAHQDRDVEGCVDVCLVSMPYANLALPSMGLGLLKALLERQGITTRVVHANLQFAALVGLTRYQRCAVGVPTDLLAGEWTFRTAAFGGDERADARFRELAAQRLGGDEPPDPGRAHATTEALEVLREAAAPFVDRIARQVLATGARVVGCTSTFEQHVASLALLRRVRELDPGVVTVLGGANCETDMGQATHEAFGWVDYVVSGEADGIIGPLMARLLADGRDVPVPELPRGVLGPAHRRALPLAGHRPAPLARSLFRDLDTLPCPDYGDWFTELASGPLAPYVMPGLPVETSRGCWWGAKHQCTFCGLNGSSLTYDSKTPETVLAELHELRRRHGVDRFEVVDNILDTHYFATLLPELAREADPDRSLFYEVKANLSRRHVEQLVAAGVTWVQPGIESLDTGVLRLMDKGVQAWQNVQLLRWADELGLRVVWSVLWGFPGEGDDAYQRMADLVPLLEHLQAPASLAQLRYDRYSVYHNEPERFGLDLRPVPAMELVYPLGRRQLADLAYFFVADAGPPDLATRPGVRALRGRLRAWKHSAAAGAGGARLVAADDGTALHVTDTRACAVQRETTLTGLDRLVALAAGDGVPVERVERWLADQAHPAADPRALRRSVEHLRERGLVLVLDGRLVGLPVADGAPPLPATTDFPGGRVAYRPLPEDRRATAPLPATLTTA